MPVTSWSNYLKRVASDVPNSTIAELAGVDVSQVSRWKSGATIPTEKTARQLALGLDLREDEALAAAGHLKLPLRPARPSPPISKPSDLPGGLGGYFLRRLRPGTYNRFSSRRGPGRYRSTGAKNSLRCQLNRGVTHD